MTNLDRKTVKRIIDGELPAMEIYFKNGLNAKYPIDSLKGKSGVLSYNDKPLGSAVGLSLYADDKMIIYRDKGLTVGRIAWALNYFKELINPVQKKAVERLKVEIENLEFSSIVPVIFDDDCSMDNLYDELRQIAEKAFFGKTGI